MSDEATLTVDRIFAAMKGLPAQQRKALIDAIRDMVEVHVQARQHLEAKVKSLEVAADAEARIRQLAASTEQKIDQQQAMLDKMNRQLGALLTPTASARRTAVARLRQ